MSESKYRTGQVVWRELMTSDVSRARGFYGELLGWTFKDMPMSDGSTYTLVQAGEAMVGGMMGKPPGMEMPSCWSQYVSVTDVDAALAAAKENGGQVYFGPMDAKEVGRFATIGDPTGAAIGVLRASDGDGPAPGMPAVGTFCWETLNSTNPAASIEFFSKLFAWTKQDGPMNVMAAGDAQVCDVQEPPPGMPSHFLSHVVVENLAASIGRAGSLGAQVMMPEIPIPGIGKIGIIMDPTGAAISLFEPAPPPSAN